MPDALAAALAEFQAAIPRVSKDAAAIVQTKAGGTYGYKYADLASLTQIALPLLAKFGMSFTCCPHLRDDGKFVLRYSLRHTGGGHIDGDYPLPTSAVPQAIGSAITYGRRYCLCAVTGIAPDEDDDDAADWPANKDGSLSRSRTSDEQKEAAGVMTSSQQKEHSALVRETTGGQPPAERLTETPADDPFYDQPEPEPPDFNAPGSIRQRQSKAMHAKFNELGIKERNARLRWSEHALKLPPGSLGTSADLSYRQAGDLLAALQRAGNGQEAT